MQGLLELAGLPYVGAGVLGSAASMDKETAKRLWREAGLSIVDFEIIHRDNTAEERKSAGARLGWPLLVKPCSAGSSLGASRVNDERDLDSALAHALQFDTRALLETAWVERAERRLALPVHGMATGRGSGRKSVAAACNLPILVIRQCRLQRVGVIAKLELPGQPHQPQE